MMLAGRGRRERTKNFYLDEVIDEYPEFDEPIAYTNRYEDVRNLGEYVLNLQPVDVPPEAWIYWSGDCVPILRS